MTGSFQLIFNLNFHDQHFRYILTAAHCLQPDPEGVEDIPIPPPENMTVIVGK